MKTIKLKTTKVVLEEKPFSRDNYSNIVAMMRAQGINCSVG